MKSETTRTTLKVYLVKPSHYDDEGYVIQWLRSPIPSNTLAVMHGLVRDSADRQVLGPDVDIEVAAIDETNTRVRADRLIAEIRAAGGRALVGLVGVQSNQFPRALDIARPLRAAGVNVVIGGFHVSGCKSMLKEMPSDIREAQDLGISLFLGEAENGLDDVLIDAFAGTLAPVYDHMKDLPGLESVPLPLLPAGVIARTGGKVTSFDAGRGCPFQCSFCTIINVQGRKSRFRSVEDIEAIVRDNLAQGIQRFFITDDNLARNRNWEAIFDRLAEIQKERHFTLIIQVDTLCHRIPNFITKAAAAGVRRVFIGLENINPESLVGAKKKQNRIAEYRKMLLEWKAVGCMTYAGYILGFPNDTPETIVRDIEIIKRELPLDLLEFFCLTPLPGSEDHQKLTNAGVWMDPDMNKYDLEHVTTTHPRMSKAEWEHAYKLAWKTYYTPDHMATIMRRAGACGISPGKMMFLLVWFVGAIQLENIHPLEGGYFRRKYRTDRRPGMPIENPITFYAKYAAELVVKHIGLGRLVWQLAIVRRAIKKDKNARNYMDTALMPVTDADLETLDMFQATDSARIAADRARALKDKAIVAAE